MDFPRCERCWKRGDRHDVRKGYNSSINYETGKVSKEFICSNKHVWHEVEIWKAKYTKDKPTPSEPS